MKTKTYYHIIEESFGLFGWHGYRDTFEEAYAEAKRLSMLFHDCFFYVEELHTKNEPNYINC